jgi:GNAT superfamily N-acetyltransferase
MDSNYKIMTMKPQEIKLASEWAALEGWNPGLYDAECFYRIDPNGCFIGKIKDKPISCILAVSYDDNFGFLGFYIVLPEYRKKGYGIALWKESLLHFKNQNIGVDGVFEQQENYKKSGFKFAYRNIRYQGKSIKSNIIENNIVRLHNVPFDELLQYDRPLFPSRRAEFLKCWTNQPESLSIGFVEHDKLKGYGVLRKCVTGYKIGPLFADDEKIATIIFLQLNNHLMVNTPVFLDVPEVNYAATRIAQGFNMKPVFGTARMYTKEKPAIDLNKIFGVTSFEVG